MITLEGRIKLMTSNKNSKLTNETFWLIWNPMTEQMNSKVVI